MRWCKRRSQEAREEQGWTRQRSIQPLQLKWRVVIAVTEHGP